MLVSCSELGQLSVSSTCCYTLITWSSSRLLVVLCEDLRPSCLLVWPCPSRPVLLRHKWTGSGLDPSISSTCLSLIVYRCPSRPPRSDTGGISNTCLSSTQISLAPVYRWAWCVTYLSLSGSPAAEFDVSHICHCLGP